MVLFIKCTIRDSDATVFVTGQCNSNCIMCPASDYERKTMWMPLKRRLYHQIAEESGIVFTFNGKNLLCAKKQKAILLRHGVE